MKIVIGVLGGLGIASLLTGAVLSIQSQTIAQRSEEVCVALREDQARVEAAVTQGFNVRPEIILPIGLNRLEGSTQHRCVRLDAYSEAFCGFALTFITLAVVAWRHKKLRDVKHQTDEPAAESHRGVCVPQTQREGVPANVIVARKEQPVRQ